MTRKTVRLLKELATCNERFISFADCRVSHRSAGFSQACYCQSESIHYFNIPTIYSLLNKCNSVVWSLPDAVKRDNSVGHSISPRNVVL